MKSKHTTVVVLAVVDTVSDVVAIEPLLGVNAINKYRLDC